MATAGTVELGSWRFPPPGGEGLAVPAYKSAAKIDKKESAGKDDALTTFRGKKTGDVKIALEWDELHQATDDYAVRMLADVSPRGPNAGKPWEYVGVDQQIHNAHNVEVEDLEGPVRTPGTSKVTATLACSTWTKPAPTPAVTKTPSQPEPWGAGPKVAIFSKVKKPAGPQTTGAGGFADPNTAPKVTP